MKIGSQYRHHNRHAQDDPLLQGADGAILRAALEVMYAVHGEQSRGKADLSIRYTSHTLMVYDLLTSMQMTDPCLLAAGLLHDVLEEPGWDSARLHASLAAAMRKQGVDDTAADAACASVVAICRQVKNPDFRKEGKLVMQLGEIPQMGQAAKIVKIADQSASLLCNLLLPNSHDFPRSKALSFAGKAWQVVDAIARYPTTIEEDGSVRNLRPSERQVLHRWRQLFHALEEYNQRLLQAPERFEDKIRRRFRDRLDYLIARPVKLHSAQVKADTELLVDFPKDENSAHAVEDEAWRQGGISRVTLNRNGRVNSFVVWVDPAAEDTASRNALCGKLYDHFQRDGRLLAVNIARLQPVTVGGQTLLHGREYQFVAPLTMGAERFARIARQAGAMGEEECARLIEIAKHQKSAHDFSTQRYAHHARHFHSGGGRNAPAR